MADHTYTKVLSSGIVIASTRPEHARQLEVLQEICFPTLAPEQRFLAPHYLKHIELFPQGQFVALADGRVVGMTSTIRMHFDFKSFQHSFDQILQGGWLTSHEPDGPWLYGADIGTHPEFRRRGIARGLYAARHDTVKRLGLAGQVTVGMMSGYGAAKGTMTAQEYYQGLQTGSVIDPTVTAQKHVGFEVRGLIPNYLDDPVCDGYGVCLVLDASRQVAGQ